MTAWPKICALGVFLVALWAQTNAMVGAFYDDGIYVSLAKALAEGHGYRNIHLPGSPPGLHYPPLYPLVLSLAWRVWPAFPDNVTLFQLIDCAALAGAAWIIVAHSSRWTDSRLVRYLALPAAFTAFPLLTIVGVRLSEPLFLLFFSAAIALADRDRSTVTTAVVAGGLAGLAALTRSLGVVAIAGVAAGLWFRRERKHAVLSALAGVLVMSPWLWWVAAHSGELDPRLAANYGTYAQEAAQAGPAGFVAGLDFRVFLPVAGLLLPRTTPWVWYPFALALAALIAWGCVRARFRAPATVATFGAYVVVVALWPYAPDRFVWIVLPLLGSFLCLGLEAAWAFRPWSRIAAGVVAVVIAVGYLPREALSLVERRFATAALGASEPARVLAPSLMAGTPDSAVVAAESEATVFLYAHRRSVPGFLFRWKGRGVAPLGPDSTLAFFCDYRVSFVTLSSPFAESAPAILALAARADSTLTPIVPVTSGPAIYRLRCPT